MAPATTSSLLARVRQSCETQLQHSDCAVRIKDERVAAFVEELDWAQYEELAAPQRFPLNFKSLEDEVNFLTIHAMLNFGSGYRKDLHKLCDRGAAETILFGLIGMYISVPRFNADYLSNISIDVLADYFSIPLDREEAVSTGIYVSKPGPLRPFAEMIHKVVTESAEKLKQLQLNDFGAFVMANLRKSESDKPSAVHLVEELVSTFPAFDDHRTSRDGHEVFFLKRAQLVAASLYRRFRDSDERFDFEDISELTALTDNVLPCVLRALGITEYDADLGERIDRGEELPAGDFECDIRASAVVACDRIVSASRGRLAIDQLDTYLWRVGGSLGLNLRSLAYGTVLNSLLWPGKEPRFRGLERHATRDTFFY